MSTILLAVLAAGCDGRSAPADDAGRDSANDGGSDLDAGSDGGPMCEEDLRSPYTGPVPCSVETRDCAAACETRDCAEDCFLADENAACIGCWDVNQLSCWNRNGCQDEFNCLSTCIRTECPSADPTCIGDRCSAEDIVYAACFEPFFTTCLERTIACLPE